MWGQPGTLDQHGPRARGYTHCPHDSVRHFEEDATLYRVIYHEVQKRQRQDCVVVQNVGVSESGASLRYWASGDRISKPNTTEER